jgi:tocopherol O-methyltransferase
MATRDINPYISNFYDVSTALWEEFWGEHLHHGYYNLGESIATKNPQQAQIDLIKELVSWSELANVTNFLDVGCGVGGSSLWLARHFGADGTGITLSPKQANRANQKAQELSLQNQVHFQVADALALPFPNDSFDLVWSLESAEHMADKQQLLAECYRSLRLGGRLILATWCHRETTHQPLTNYEQSHLDRIYSAYYLPFVISLSEYATIARAVGFQNIRVADWTRETAPFWDAVWQSALTPNALWGILRYGLATMSGALAVRLMIRGYEMGLLKFGVLTATKT